METTFVRARGLRLRVATQGDGPPLLLITGLGANIEMWAPFTQLLSGRTVIAFDAPGMGQSEGLRRPLRMPGLADIARDLLRELGHDRADVLGYSLGGGVAQELAHRHPDAVDRLLLCGTSFGIGGLPPLNPIVPLVLMTPQRYYSPRYFRCVGPIIAGGRTARDREWLERTIEARVASPPSWTGYAHQVYAGSGWSSLPWLHSIRARTLVLAGGDDPIMPVVNARILAWRIPDARLEVLEGAGHLFLVDEPERAAPPIRAFLDEAA